MNTPNHELILTARLGYTFDTLDIIETVTR